jgi:hypothetical protein
MWDQKVPECYCNAELVLELRNLQGFSRHGVVMIVHLHCTMDAGGASILYWRATWWKWSCRTPQEPSLGDYWDTECKIGRSLGLNNFHFEDVKLQLVQQILCLEKWIKLSYTDLVRSIAVICCSFKTWCVLTICSMRSNQVKATAGNVDEAVRELPDANLVRYIYFLMFRCC